MTEGWIVPHWSQNNGALVSSTGVAAIAASTAAGMGRSFLNRIGQRLLGDAPSMAQYAADVAYNATRSRTIGLSTSSTPSKKRKRSTSSGPVFYSGRTHGMDSEVGYMKYFDTPGESFGEVNGGNSRGTSALLFNPVPGTGPSDRIGRSVTINGLELVMSMERRNENPSGGTPLDFKSTNMFLRVCLIVDNQCNQGEPLAADLWDGNTPVAPPYTGEMFNPDNQERFSVLHDKVYRLNQDTDLFVGGEGSAIAFLPTNRMIHIKMAGLSIPVRYVAGSTPGVNYTTSGGLFFCWSVCNNGQAYVPLGDGIQWAVSYTCRTYFQNI